MSKVPARGPMRSGARLRLRAGEPGDDNVTDAKRVETKEKDRSYYLALGSLMVSIVVAISAPLSAWVIARQGFDAASSQAQNSFLLDQKKVAYANFYTTAGAAGKAEAEMGIFLLSTVRPPVNLPTSPEERSQYIWPRFVELQKEWSSSITDVNTSYATLFMVGGDDVIDAAREMRDFLFGRDVAKARSALYEAAVRGTELSDKYVEYLEVLDSSVILAERYLKSVREDYGQDADGHRFYYQ